MVKKLTFTIDANGEVKMEASGFTGSECESFSKPFEEALGTLSQREHKDTYYVCAEETQNQEESL